MTDTPVEWKRCGCFRYRRANIAVPVKTVASVKKSDIQVLKRLIAAIGVQFKGGLIFYDGARIIFRTSVFTTHRVQSAHFCF